MTNHGGRQVDGAVGSLEVLPEIVEAVGNSACSRFFLTVVKTRGWYKCGVRARGDDDHLRLGYSHGCRCLQGHRPGGACRHGRSPVRMGHVARGRARL